MEKQASQTELLKEEKSELRKLAEKIYKESPELGLTVEEIEAQIV